MFFATTKLSLRAVAASSAVILAAAFAHPLLAQVDMKGPVAAPPMVSDVKTKSPRFAKETMDARRGA